MEERRRILAEKYKRYREVLERAERNYGNMDREEWTSYIDQVVEAWEEWRKELAKHGDLRGGDGNQEE